jgi:uncharacterized protein (TIGR03437 family)
MKFHHLAFLIAFILLSPLNRAQTPDFTAMDRVFQEMRTRLNANFSVVIRQNGQRLFEKDYGTSNVLVPIPIASASKWWSGALILKLVEEGKLSLDDTVRKHLPSYTGPLGNATIRQLFAHTSGLGREDSSCIFNFLTNLTNCVNDIANRTLVATPGAEFHYANTSMHIGGRIIEVVTGQSFVDAFRERFGGPLRMPTTQDWLTRNSNPIVAGGGISSTADYMRFMEMLLGGGTLDGVRVLQPESVDQLLRDQTEGARLVYSLLPIFEPLRAGVSLSRYGVGNWILKQEKGQGVLNSSPGAFGFTPVLDLERNLTMTVGVGSEEFVEVLPFVFRAKDALDLVVPVAPYRRGGVTNAASYRAGFVAPGQLVTIFGTNLGAREIAFGPVVAGVLQSRAGATQVFFDDRAAPVLYARADSVTVQVPFELAGRLETSLSIQVGSNRLAGIRVPVLASGPGIFSADASGQGVAAALNVLPDGSTQRHSAQNPAVRGSFVSLYATGLGNTAPVSTTGKIAVPGNLQTLSILPQVLIGGIAAEVTYAGNAEGLLEGITQLNVRVPANSGVGQQSVVVIAADRQQSTPVTLFLR